MYFALIKSFHENLSAFPGSRRIQLPVCQHCELNIIEYEGYFLVSILLMILLLALIHFAHEPTNDDFRFSISILRRRPEESQAFFLSLSRQEIIAIGKIIVFCKTYFCSAYLERHFGDTHSKVCLHLPLRTFLG